MTSSEDYAGRLDAIARRAADAIMTVTGAASQEVLSLRAFEACRAQVPAQDLYLLLRFAEHSLAGKHPALGRLLRRYGYRVERIA